jgi:transcriptional regulator with XRE-family HTH domain
MKGKRTPNAKQVMRSNSRKLREKMGLTKVEVAAIAGIGIKPLERVDRGDPHIRLDTLFRIALALGASPVDIWPALAARPKAARATHTRYRAEHRNRRRPPNYQIDRLVRNTNEGLEP